MKSRVAENNQGNPTSSPLSPLAATLKLAALYGGLGIAWILISDHILSSIVEDVEKLTRYQTLKGVVYVLATAAIFCLVLYHELVKRQFAQRQLLEKQREVPSVDG